jgi:tetratricopeptide (TPR) repeat protein
MYSMLGTALKEAGRYRDAQEAYQKAVRAAPDNAWYHYNLGSAFLRDGQHDQAIGAFRDALRIGPARPEMYCNLGSALKGAGRYRDALDNYRRGHELGSKQPGWKYPSAQWIRECEALLAKEESRNGKRETLPPPRAAGK